MPSEGPLVMSSKDPLVMPFESPLLSPRRRLLLLLCCPLLHMFEAVVYDIGASHVLIVG